MNNDYQTGKGDNDARRTLGERLTDLQTICRYQITDAFNLATPRVEDTWSQLWMWQHVCNQMPLTYQLCREVSWSVWALRSSHMYARIVNRWSCIVNRCTPCCALKSTSSKVQKVYMPLVPKPPCKDVVRSEVPMNKSAGQLLDSKQSSFDCLTQLNKVRCKEEHS